MLSYQHTKLLKKIKKNKVIRNSKPNKDLDYLCENGLIEMIECDKPNDFYAEPYITEKGKAELDEQRRWSFALWFPIAISALFSLPAFIISIMSLLK